MYCLDNWAELFLIFHLSKQVFYCRLLANLRTFKT
jgi:hypothetical protein